MLTACTAAQKPYYVAYSTATAYVGDSPGGACKYFADGASVTLTNVTEHACFTSAGTWAIVKSCDDGPQPSSTSGTTSGTSVPVDLASLGVTPETALQAFGFGFGSVLLMWAIGYAIGIATGMTKKV